MTRKITNDVKTAKKTAVPKKSRRALWIVLIVIGAIALLFAALIVVGTIFYYASNSSSYDYDDYGYEESYGDTELIPSSPLVEEEYGYEYDDTEDYSTGGTAAGGDDLSEQKVIKTSYLDVTVESVDDTVSDLNTLIDAQDGFVESTSTGSYSAGSKYGTVILKVPVDRFETTLEAVKNLASDISSEDVSGQDVTSDYTDLEARFRNYQAEEEQYLLIMDSAESVEDSLSVAAALADVRENIEIIQGQLDYLRDQTEMSTITVYLGEEISIDIPTEDWKPLTTVKTAFNSWVRFLQVLIDMAIWLVIYLVPFVILIWAIVKLIIKLVRRKRNKQK